MTKFDRFGNKVFLAIYFIFVPQTIMYSSRYNRDTFVEDCKRKWREIIMTWRMM